MFARKPFLCRGAHQACVVQFLFQELEDSGRRLFRRIQSDQSGRGSPSSTDEDSSTSKSTRKPNMLATAAMNRTKQTFDDKYSKQRELKMQTFDARNANVGNSIEDSINRQIGRSSSLDSSRLSFAREASSTRLSLAREERLSLTIPSQMPNPGRAISLPEEMC